MKIPYNKPFLIGNETKYIKAAIKSGKISGNGMFTKKCQEFFETKFGFRKCLLTTSCTDALEMCAMLCDIKDGDEVIIPSYTFVSTALAFVREGAKIVFADSRSDNPNIDENAIESLITPKTKVLVIVHYAGTGCEMEKITEIVKKHNLILVEDCAQAFESYYDKKPLGSFGHLATFSFHETKNIISGEGGLLVVNDETMIKRAEILWEKGTNRADFSRKLVNKYEWIDLGSSFLPSEIIAAFLYAQLEKSEKIQKKRIALWFEYFKLLKPLSEIKKISLSCCSGKASINGHIFYIICKDYDERKRLMDFLGKNGILAVSHYLSLHKSPFSQKYLPNGFQCPNSDEYENRLLRLPLYYELKIREVREICKLIKQFYTE
jgi:dTDP-4-amino-4,6-dideoxygalactose transaminase